jgi:Putative transposase
LNLHVHFHTIAVDGVFEKTDHGVRFHEAPPSSKDDVAEVAKRVRDRSVRWLRRHGYLDERAAEERGNEAAEPSALDGCMQLALAGGAFLARPPPSPCDTTDADLERRERRFSATCDGFDVHCAVRLAADDDQGRERLVRYCTRPPFALDRLEVLRDGRIAYLLKVPRKGRTHRIMAPMELMARLSALIPPPRIPMGSGRGVFASRSSWRPLVTLKPPSGAKPKPCVAAPSASASASASPAPGSASSTAASPATESIAAASSAAAAPAPAPTLAVGVRGLTVAAVPVEPVVAVDATMITVAHWGRLEEGELFGWSRRLEWAVMMKRTFGFAVLRCPRCSRQMRVVSTITEPAVVRQILDHLGVRASPLPRAPARDPDWEQVDLGFEGFEAA